MLRKRRKRQPELLTLHRESQQRGRKAGPRAEPQQPPQGDGEALTCVRVCVCVWQELLLWDGEIGFLELTR